MFQVQIQKFTPTKNPKYLKDYEVWVRRNTIRFHASQRLIKNLESNTLSCLPQEPEIDFFANQNEKTKNLNLKSPNQGSAVLKN